MKSTMPAATRKIATFRRSVPASPEDGSATHPRHFQTTAMVERLDELFSTLRSKKISMSTYQAILKLSLATRTERSSLPLSQLADKIGITTTAITTVADGLEKMGLAKRRQDPNDRRSILISLTPKGVAFADKYSTVAQP